MCPKDKTTHEVSRLCRVCVKTSETRIEICKNALKRAIRVILCTAETDIAARARTSSTKTCAEGECAGVVGGSRDCSALVGDIDTIVVSITAVIVHGAVGPVMILGVFLSGIEVVYGVVDKRVKAIVRTGARIVPSALYVGFVIVDDIVCER